MHNQMNCNIGCRPGEVRLPNRAPKCHGNRPRPGAPVDPDELTRRLYLVLADQKAFAERTKRAQQEAEKQAKAARKRSSSNQSELKSPPPTADSLTPALKKSLSILSIAKKKTSKATLNVRPDNGNDGNTHPYVPREAAAQFTITTTAMNMREGGLTHKLSRQALKYHLTGDKFDPNTTASEQTKALKRAQSRREQVHERNQFQRTRILEDAAEEVEERGQQLTQRHTFAAGTTNRKDHQFQHHEKQRRSSTGDLLEVKLVKSGRGEANLYSQAVQPDSPVHCGEVSSPMNLQDMALQAAQEHRVDWTQSDEMGDQRHRILAVAPVLRRPVSIWALRDRLGHHSKHGRKEKEGAVRGTTIAEVPEPPKSTRGGFFSRFRR